MTEVCHLVAKERVARGAVIESLAKGRLHFGALGTELTTIAKMLHRYADVRMDFADACVLRLAELHPGTAVCTTDSDFRFYRLNDREPVPLLAPFAL